MYYLQLKIKKYFPTIYNFLDLSIEKILNPLIDEKVNLRLEEKLKDIVNTIDNTIKKLVDDKTIEIKSNVNELFKQLLWEKLNQIDCNLKDKLQKEIDASNELAEKKIQEVDSKIKGLEQDPNYTTSTALEKLVMNICLEVEKKYPQKGMGKTKKHVACLELDKIKEFPDKKLQRLRQSSRKIDTVEFRQRMLDLIDKMGGGL